jgi:hypothetical protein
MITRLYGHELREKVLATLTAIPQVQRVNYLEYWNDQSYLVFLDPNDEAAQQAVEAALKSVAQATEGARSSSLTWRFYATTAAVPSSATLYQRSTV